MTSINEFIQQPDLRGRLRFTPEQKKSIVVAYIVGGLSASRFAVLHGLNYQTLLYWVKKSQTAVATTSPRSSHPALLSLVPAEIDNSDSMAASHAVEVYLTSGTKIIITAPGQLDLVVRLIRQLQDSRPC